MQEKHSSVLPRFLVCSNVLHEPKQSLPTVHWVQDNPCRVSEAVSSTADAPEWLCHQHQNPAVLIRPINSLPVVSATCVIKCSSSLWLMAYPAPLACTAASSCLASTPATHDQDLLLQVMDAADLHQCSVAAPYAVSPNCSMPCRKYSIESCFSPSGTPRS